MERQFLNRALLICVLFTLFHSEWVSAQIEPPTASLLVLEHEGELWQIDLNQFGFDGIDPTTVDRNALKAQLGHIAQEVKRTPQNAYFNKRQIVSHMNGVQADEQALEDIIDRLVGMQNQVLPVPVKETEPDLTAHTLSRLTEKVLGQYRTTFNPRNSPRVNNVKLSSEAIDYTVVPVGGIFSFNEIVGPRTVARGYKPAPIIVRGEYSEGVGGGICQTSSTLFNSVDEAGLKIVERTVHSKIVTYVPKGRDATVSWGGPDFKFKNDTNRPILIASEVAGGGMTVTISSMSDVKTKPQRVPPPPDSEPPQQKSFQSGHHRGLSQSR